MGEAERGESAPVMWLRIPHIRSYEPIIVPVADRDLVQMMVRL